MPIRQGQVFNSMKINSFKQQTVQLQHEKEMHLLPSTPKYYKRTYRHYFKRRMNQMERPVIIINFQGVLGDFLKDGGLSTKQDHLMSKAYIKEFNHSLKQSAVLPNRCESEKSIKPIGEMKMSFINEPQNYHMWVRLGVNEGMKYLSKHFQIIIFNRDVLMEEFGKQFSQV